MNPFATFTGLSPKLPQKTFAAFGANVIWQAIEGKYDGITRNDVVAIIDSQNSIEATPAHVDVQRQWKCMQRIEHEWRFRSICLATLDEMHCELYGLDMPVRRSEPLILQDEHTRTVDIDDIDRELGLLAPLLLSVDSVSPATGLDPCLLLAARIMAELIRIHPYPDGNGRVARMTVNLCFRKWQLPYIAIAKVRNDLQWQAALRDAVLGNATPVANVFRELIFRSLELLPPASTQ